MSTEPKTYFGLVHEAATNIRVLQERRQHYMELATGGSGQATVRRVKGNHHSVVESAGLKLADLAGEMEEREQEFVELIRQAETVIGQLEHERHRNVLTLRYLAGKSWEDIAAIMGYTDVRSVFKTHGWALEAVKKYLP